jgi:PAS domain S-box-containing protein
MNILSLSESNLINGMLKNPDEDFQKIVGLIENKLKQSVKRYTEILQNSIEATCIINSSEVITSINQRMLEIGGYSKQEMIGKSIFSLMSEVEARDFKNHLENRKKGISEKYEVKLSRKNGEEIYVKVKAAPLYDESGNYDGSVAFIEDITEKRKNEKLIRESEEKYRTLIEGLTQMEIGVDIVGLNHNVIYQNDLLKGRFGDHHGRKCYEHYLGQKKSCKICPMEKAIKSNKVEKATIFGQENRIYEILSAPLSNKEGKVDRAAEVIIDVTERVQIEQKLRESEEIFRTMAEQSLAAIGILQNNEFKYINEAYSEFTGIPLNEIYSMKADDFLDKILIVEDKERFKKHSKVTQSGERITYSIIEGRVINQLDNEVRWLLVSAKSIVFQGKPAAMNLALDITERRQAEADLKREKLFTEEALNAQRDTFFVFEPSSGKAIRWNKAFREISGYSDEEILAMRAPDSYYDEKNLQRAAEATRLIEEKSASYVKMDLITKDGNSIPFEYIGSSITDEEGNLKYIVSVGRDITDRKKAEQIIKESEFNLKKAQEMAHIGHWKLDPSTLEVTGSDELFKIFGLTHDEATLEKFADVVHPEDRENDLYHIRRGIEEGIPWDIEHRLICKDGTEKWIHAIGYPTKDETGKIISILGTVQDITERKKIEHELKESEEKYRTITEQALMGIAIVQDNVVKYSSQRLAEIFGYSVEEMLNSEPSGFLRNIHRDMAELVKERINKKQLGKKDVKTQYQVKIIRKTGEEAWIENYSKTINYDGKPAVLITNIDITDRKKAEQKLIESEEKFRLLFEAIADPIHVIDADLKIIYMNPAFEKWLKSYNLYFDAIGKNPVEVWPHIGEEVNDEYKKVFETKKIHIKRDWEQINDINMFTETRKIPIIKSGKVIQIITIVRDFSDRKKAEQKLKESEEKFRNFTEQSLMGVAIIQDNVVKYASKRLADIYGYTVKEMLNFEPNGFLKLIDPEFLEIVKEQATKKQLGQEGTITHYEVKCVKKTGEKFWVENYSKTIYYKGKPADFVTNIDITERKKTEQLLKESEEKFRTIAEQSFMGIGILQDDELIYANMKLANMYGYNVEEFIGKTYSEFINLTHPEDRAKVIRKVEKRKDRIDKTITFYQFRALKKTGELFWASIYSRIINYQGKRASLVTILDITEMKTAELKLKQSEENFRTITEDSHLAITILQDDLVVYTNQRMADLFGYDREEMLTWTPKEYAKTVAEDSLEFVMEQARKKQTGDPDVTVHYPIHSVKSSGEKFWVDNISTTIMYKGRPADLVTFIDITEKRKVEEKLKESEENYRNLIETSSMGLLEIDNVSKNIKYINPKLLEILEYNEDELLKFDSFDRFIHTEDLEEILSSSQETKLEFRIISKSGKVKWLSGDKLQYYDEKGDLMYVRFWLQDITEKKELEQIKSNLLIRFSHEFKTPLISIKGFSDLILEEYRDNVNEKIVSFLEKIKEGAITLNFLTNRFIESTKLDENLVRLNINPVKITKLINRVLVELEGVTKSRQQIIDLKIKENLVINCDSEKLFTVISNLLLNAAKFTPHGGLITVSITTKNEFVIISIKDNGIGLNKKELEKLFKPFGKIERYGQGLDIVPDGMGMGLFITKELVGLHKGTIWAESAGRNKGSIFNVKIPLNLQD